MDDGFYRSLCDNLGFIVLALDSKLTIQFWNAQAARHYSEHPGLSIGASFAELLPQESREEAQALIQRVLDRGEPGEMETKATTATGGKMTLVLIVSPIPDGAGGRMGVSVCMRDISERKRMSQQLARSRRMAALGNMAEGIVHHFNNLLGAMMTSIDYALPSESPRELRRALRLLAEAIGKGTRITKQLEAFAEVENERARPLDLGALLSEFTARLEKRTAGAGLRLSASSDDFAGLCVSQRLLPILDSLSQNSLDAMSPGGLLTFKAARVENGVHIVLADDGCGISEQDMERLFEPFFTTKGELAGGKSSNTGLGLAAVHGLVKEMNGEISITSMQGVGTRVELRIPLLPPGDTSADDGR